MSKRVRNVFDAWTLVRLLGLVLSLGLGGCAQDRVSLADPPAWRHAYPIAEVQRAQRDQTVRVVVLLEATGPTSARAHDLSGSIEVQNLPAKGPWREQPARTWVVEGELQHDAEGRPYLVVKQVVASEALPYGAYLCVHWTCGRWDEERWVWLGLDGQAFSLDRKRGVRTRWRVAKDEVHRVLDALRRARVRPVGTPDPRGAMYQFCWWTGKEWRDWEVSSQPDGWIHEILVTVDAWLQGPPTP
ncbi:MAG: hypothetical protein GXO54_06985 [Chloroflexi bacterium]|nr:hypothetical protein [Chloroflexota bacterium]